jgi:hypothetical protein
MRICDICRGPDLSTWKTAVATIVVDRIPEATLPKGMPNYQSADACIECITTYGLINFIPKKETT